MTIMLSAAPIVLSAQQDKPLEQTSSAQVPGVVTGVKIDPHHVALAPGDRRQFAAAVNGTGTFSSALKWSINDVDGGNAALGTINNSGFVSRAPPHTGGCHDKGHEHSGPR
jgi:hypothetical protein